MSPSIAFLDSRVIYADIDGDSMDALRRKGCEAQTASALEFNPGSVDVLIMLNPVIPPDIPASHIVENGYVLCNDHHATASILHSNENYRLSAVIRESKKGLIFDVDNLDDYFREVETDEEFINSTPGFDLETYRMASIVVKAVTGRQENLLAEYKKIVKGVKERERREYMEALSKDPELAKSMSDPDKSDIFILNHEGEQFVLARLPNKKGTVDDMFIFQKCAK